jgi:putative ABC transport system permease protein
MSWIKRLSATIRSRRVDHDLDEEVRFHIERRTDELIAQGVAAEEARREAERRFGNRTLLKERARDRDVFVWLETAVQDIRYALRTLRRNPGFAATAILSLALGIGANTAIFSLIDALLLRWLPVRDPQQLVEVMTFQNGKRSDSFSYPVVRALADQKQIFSGLCGFSGTIFNTGPRDAVERTPGAWVSGEYYETLGLRPAIGRLLRRDDDQPGAVPVAVITDEYWQRKFSRDPQAVGRAILVEGVPVIVAGVSPAGFSGANVGEIADITLPLAANTQLFPEMTGRLTAGPEWLRILARPQPGVSMNQAKAGLAVIWPQLANVAVTPRMAAARRKALLTSTLDVIPGGTGWTTLRSQFRRPLLVLMALVGMVLLIACANVANLLLARAQARQREIAVRLAIGASPARLIRQLLTESLLLASFGAAVAVAFAWFASRLLVQLLSTWSNAIALDLTPDWRVFAFAAALAIGTGILFGIVPALRATAVRPSFRTRFNSMLVAAQVAVSFVMLIGAGLFVRTFENLDHVDPGFRHEGVLLVSGDVHRAVTPAGTAFYLDLLQQIEGLPGVVSASLASNTPLSGGIWTDRVAIDNQPPSGETAHINSVAPRFFETMRTPLVAGRDFTNRDDPSAPSVAIVNEAFVRRWFLDGHSIGRLVSAGSSLADMQIVGVVKDAISQTLREPPPPAVYVPIFQRQTEFPTFVVYASGSLTRVASELRRQLQSDLPNTAIEIHTLTSQVEAALVQERLMATLAGAFGALALILAAVGLYGLIAYTVARRTSELGIRIALGAGHGNVMWLVIEGALRLLGFGLLLGLPAAWAASRLVTTMLWGLNTNDPATIGAAVGLLTLAGLLAGWVPARRAARIDPMASLRCE